MKSMNFKSFTILIITSVFLFSCNSDELFEVASNKDKPTGSENWQFRLTEKEAIENLQSFLDDLDQPSENDIFTRSKPIRTIANVQVICKNSGNAETLINDDQSTLRSLLSTAQKDTIFYLINFEDEGGFAIVSADKRSNKVYAIIDEGALNVNEIDQVDNPGFNMFMENAILAELNNIDNYDLVYEIESNREPERPGTTRPGGLPNKVEPLLKTKWGQGHPYNAFSPNGTTGCVPTAIAQILSYYQPINKVNYTDYYYNTNPSSNLTWSKILSDCENASVYGILTSSSAQSSLQVAHLMRYIGISIGAYYDYGETTANSIKAISWLRNNKWFSSITSSQEYDAVAAYIALSEGDLIYMSASSGGNVGHAWVGDGGFIFRNTTQGRENITLDYYLHCNWGWDGFCDGYYLDFDLSNGAPSLANIDQPGSSGDNYNSAKRMAIITR